MLEHAANAASGSLIFDGALYETIAVTLAVCAVLGLASSAQGTAAHRNQATPTLIGWYFAWGNDGNGCVGGYGCGTGPGSVNPDFMDVFVVYSDSSVAYAGTSEYGPHSGYNCTYHTGTVGTNYHMQQCLGISACNQNMYIGTRPYGWLPGDPWP